MTNKKHTGDLDDYNDKYLRCRGMRNHPWRFETDFSVATGPRGRIIEFDRKLSCMACDTVRIDTYAVTKSGKFKFKGRRYDYADGYQVSRGNPIQQDAARDALLMKELRSSLDQTMLNRLLSMRPETRAQARPVTIGEPHMLRVVGE